MVNAADEPLNRNFAPYVTMLQIRRQRGGVGAEFQAIDDDGTTITIVRAGFAKQKPLEVHRRDSKGRILHASGDLDMLGSIPSHAFSKDGPSNVIAVISNQTAQFAVASDETIIGGVLKMALHFYAGFVREVSIEQSTQLLGAILGRTKAAGDFVRTPLLRDEIFPVSWPPRHEITAYPLANHCLVTVLLFGAYGYTCRLPIATPMKTGFRYTQVLTEQFPRFEDSVPVPRSLDWNDRPTEKDRDAWGAAIATRLDPILRLGQEQAIQARCKRAWERATTESSNFGDIWTRYKAALELEVFPSDEVARLVAIGRHLDVQDREPWRVPVVFAEDLDSKNDA